MAESATLIPVDEYLQTSYAPANEYRDGVLTPKSMPARKHARLQGRLFKLIDDGFPGFEAATELTVCLREGRYLVPDVAVEHSNRVQDPYPTEPIHLCIEILSPHDRLSEVIAKGEEYHDWGVPTVWIIDPDQRSAWQFTRDHGLHEIPKGGTLTAGPIALPLDDVFA